MLIDIFILSLMTGKRIRRNNGPSSNRHRQLRDRERAIEGKIEIDRQEVDISVWRGQHDGKHFDNEYSRQQILRTRDKRPQTSLK